MCVQKVASAARERPPVPTMSAGGEVIKNPSAGSAMRGGARGECRQCVSRVCGDAEWCGEMRRSRTRVQWEAACIGACARQACNVSERGAKMRAAQRAECAAGVRRRQEVRRQ